MSLRSINRVFGGALLVSGTCIGAGMLSLPLATALGGFVHAFWLFVGCCTVMTLTALFMLEVSLWFPKESNFISMSSQLLGRFGSGFAWLCYVFFLYALMVAYTVGGASILEQILKAWWPLAFSTEQVTIAFVGFFALIVSLGTGWVDSCNRWLMLGLVLGYSALICFIAPKIQFSMVARADMPLVISAIPLIVTSFGFHLLIPSLKSYMAARVQALRWAIMLGSIFAFSVYTLWVYVIFNVLPIEGPAGLGEIAGAKAPIAELMQALDAKVGSAWVSVWARIFGLFALLSSFLGISLGLSDFFADGLGLQKKAWGKGALTVLTFGIPCVLALLYPRAFLPALGYAGIFAAILLIMYPAVMVLVGRRTSFVQQQKNAYRVVGGSVLPFLALVFGVFVVVLQCW